VPDSEERDTGGAEAPALEPKPPITAEELADQIRALLDENGL